MRDANAPTLTVKRCGRCKQQKPISDFLWIRKSGTDRYYWGSYCRPCRNEYAKASRQKHREKRIAAERARYWADPEKSREVQRSRRDTVTQKRYHLQRYYRMSLDEYEALNRAQGGICAICGRAPSGSRKYLAVDHDHATGKIRGLLCTTCNVGLGALRDSADLLRAALVYLEGG